MARALITMPKTAQRGEVIEIRVLIAHPMETGLRANAQGSVMPRNIITAFTCRYGNEVIFSAQFYPAIAANPYVAFFTTATTSAELSFTWEGDNGFAQRETAALTVT